MPPQAISSYENVKQARRDEIARQNVCASNARDFARTMTVRQKNGDDWHIEIWRSSADKGNVGLGNEKYYKSEIQLCYKNEVIFRASVQTSADHPNLNNGEPEFEGRTLPADKYTATLWKNTRSYILGMVLFEKFMIHPDQFTTELRIQEEKGNKGPWNRPFGLGCMVMKLADFYKMTGLMMAAGYKFENQNFKGTVIQDTIKVEIHVNSFLEAQK